MEAIETPAMIAAMVMLFGVVGAKVSTTQLIDRMNGQISHVEQDKKEALSRLRGTQNQKSVAEQNLRLLETKKNKSVFVFSSHALAWCSFALVFSNDPDANTGNTLRFVIRAHAST